MLQGFTEPSNDDNILEVVAVLGASQMVRKLLFFVQLALKLLKCARKWHNKNFDWILPYQTIFDVILS